MNKSILLQNGTEAMPAKYTEFPLAEFNENPLIQALPPIADKQTIIKKLMVTPDYNEKERYIEGTYRTHMVNRLFQLFQPLPIHLEVWNMIQTLMLQGYLARNPFDKTYIKYINETGKEIINRSFDINSRPNFRSTSGCGLFLGHSGVGKTTSINRVLSNFPQVIVHSEYKGMHFNQIQLVWLKLEAPVNSSLKAICLQFFMKVDEVLGTNNYKKHISRNSSVDNMLPLISQVAHNIGLGLLIIDEVQNIKKRGSDQIMNFLVYLINSGINLCLIGTPGAYDLFGREMRITRRLTGNTEIIYNNLKNNSEFSFLLESVWNYQWTQNFVSYNDEFKDLFYEETQGISDLMVKLFVYSQQEAILTGQEKLSVKLVKKVAREKFKLLQPMIEAIKSGNPHKIAKYEDIRRIDWEQDVAKEIVELKQRPLNRRKIKSTRDEQVEMPAIKTKSKKIKHNEYRKDDLRFLQIQGIKEEKDPYQVLNENGYIEDATKWVRNEEI